MEIDRGLILSSRASVFLLAVGVWSWAIWPNFLRNIAADSRSFHDGAPTSFFLVHLVLVVVSLAIGTAIGVLGWRGWRARRRHARGSVGGSIADSAAGSAVTGASSPDSPW